ncbi:MAG: RNA polymerase sigma factor RpoH [Methylotenera sp.]|nr:RNA polymerase sigma factor RpoH [Methylotenera sp.]MDO9233285.1 RNA polymerase sigma factor RpoH [Methylotenera sp.]MDO9388187.1 RNA polymerase sigma factor RpoH [Methylotenera sp.]MDP2101166.1 RNA polymerase sigma factor RpoH [Methylotenera sp.]MDP2280896.1 RNA polymerase sigma factor RpoH [Methylotenera sp.]
MTNALTLPVITANDSLEYYARVIKAYPLLSAEEEHSLAVKFKQENDLEAARKLIVSHLRLVASIARGYTGYGLPQADLIQEGNIGLMKAVKRFDPERGVRLVSFAMHWIKAEIHEYIVRNWRLVKIATTKAQRKLFFNLRSMKSGINSLQSAEVAHIARELNVKPEEVLEMEARLNGHEISLEANIDDDSDEHYSPIAYLQDESLTPAEALEAKQAEFAEATDLTSALQNLDDRSRRVVEARWLQETGGKTLHELAAEFGVSAERIRQIEQKAMQKMKTLMLASR